MVYLNLELQTDSGMKDVDLLITTMNGTRFASSAEYLVHREAICINILMWVYVLNLCCRQPSVGLSSSVLE